MADTRNKIVAFVIVLLVICCVSCADLTSVAPDHLRMQIAAEPPSLNNLSMTEEAVIDVNQYVFDKLVKIDLDTLEYKPALAVSWETKSDHRTFIFHLRRDARWHDGVPFTAHDVEASFEQIMRPDFDTPSLKASYQDIESYKALDDYTVECRYKKEYFLAFDFCATMYLAPKHLMEKQKDFAASDFSRHPIGTGPYRFKEWVTNTKIVLERNEDYWGPKPAIKTIEFRMIPDASVALQILKKGDLDVLELSSVIQWTRQTNSQKFLNKFSKYVYTSLQYNYLGWNNARPLFADVRVRTALAHLVDLDTINETLNGGLGQTITGPFFLYSKQNNPHVLPLKYDVAKAKALLKEAGWEDHNGDGVLDRAGQSFDFTFIYPSASVTSERIAPILKEDFAQVGIKMTIQRLEWGAYLERILSRDFEATLSAWSTPLEYDPCQVWDASLVKEERSYNFISFVDEEASDLIRRARVEMDQKKRNELYWKFQERLYALQPITFLYTRPAMAVVSKRFENVRLHRLGLDVLEWEIRNEELGMKN